MAKNVRRLAHALGAHVVARIPDTGGGAFGAARLAAVLRARLKPGKGPRRGRPSDPAWTHHPKVPMSGRTVRRLAALAKKLSSEERKVSPMQVAAQILEESLDQFGT